MKKTNLFTCWRVWIGLLLFAATSCATARKLNYFNDLPDSPLVHLPPTVQPERLVERGDRLIINIDARTRDAAAFFNRYTASAPGSTIPAATTNETGYLVDLAGMVELPVLGKIAVAGYTTRRLKDTLTNRVSVYLKDPLVDVGFAGFRVTVLGEVKEPGTYNLAMQRTTLFEALAAAGDLPHSAKRYNISLYRDYNGHRTIAKLDLRNSSILNNPDVFQLKPNDVLYVQARPRAIFGEEFNVFTSVFTLIVGLVTLGVTITK